MSQKVGQAAAAVSAMNPWWKQPNWARRDADLVEAASSGLGYAPDVLKDLEKGALYILRGPRRVGKTVALKQAIKKLLDQGASPLSIVNISAEGMSDKELRTVIQNVPLPPLAEGDMRHWFIDEITAVSGDWDAQLKWLRDNDPEFRAATVVLTGSSAQGLTAAIGRLAGRRGKASNVNRTLMPMGFRQFAQVWYPEIANLPRLSSVDIHSPAANDGYRQAFVWLHELVKLWEVYLHYGGFPVAVGAAKKNDHVPDWFLASLFDVVYRDAFTSSSLEERQAISLLARIWQSTCTPLNARSVSEDVGIDPMLLARHIDYLRNAYLLWTCPQLDKEWYGRDRAQNKLYPVDPLIGRLPALLNHTRSELDFTQLNESQIGMVLRRHFYSTSDLWTTDQELFYYRTTTRQEIDFVGPRLGGAALEAKYVDGNHWRGEAMTVSASAYRGLMVTRSIMDLGEADETWAVPACLLAVLLDT
jgi:predicted AAA+ superfamily ATPase